RVERAAAEAGRGPGDVAASAAVLVQLPGGTGRVMGETYAGRSIEPVPVGSLAEHVEAMAEAGATHLQLVLDPITVESIEIVGELLAAVG
ncbi:MAG TPA: hypothetical protein VHO01_09050, partial [Jatrophihabitans sp.]|nr:hypothetical protein [Jatrophihabitans sp.]